MGRNLDENPRGWMRLIKTIAILTAFLAFGLPTTASVSAATGTPPKGAFTGGTVVEVDMNSTPQHIVVEFESTRHTYVVTEKTLVGKENIDTNQHTFISLDR